MLAPVAGRIIDAGHGRHLLSFGAVAGAVALVILARAETHAEFLIAWGTNRCDPGDVPL